MCFYGNQEQSVVARMGRTALLAGYVCVQILLILLFVAYRYDGGPYLGGDLYVFIMYQGFLTALAAILGYDHGDRMGRTNVLEKFSPGLSALQGWFILMVLGANGGLTVVAFLDVINHPS